jgi:large subunit ribosomal protein LP0
LIFCDQALFFHYRLLPHVRGNVGFVFTRGDLVEVRDKLLENKVRAPARNGAIAPCPVIIPAQNTGLGPEKTSFFQALSIPTKISKGTIEIIVSKVICAT